jgi:membrane-associated phospholipid phosphatase
VRILGGVRWRRERPRFQRHPSDLLRLVLGTGLLVLTGVLVNSRQVGVHEENVFRLVNDLPLPFWLWPPLWTVMQLGNLLAIPVVALAAALTRRWRLAFDAVVAGGAMYLFARVVKEYVRRGRPQDLLAGVHVHGEAATGLGYVSGHSAVAVALATVASPYLGRRGRRVAWGLALTVCLSRMWVGAHLPLDVVGGAALGWLAGVVVHLLLGAPGGQPSNRALRRALTQAGLDPIEIEPLTGLTGRRSRSFHVTSGTEDELFVKVVPRERRDADLVYRAWRRLTGARAGAASLGSPPQQVMQEAAAALMAATAGVRTPPVVLVRGFGNGGGLFVQRWVPGRSLDQLGAGEVGDDTLVALWRQAGALRRARIAHCDLARSSVVVDEAGQPWLVDFDRAQAAADPALLDADLASLFVELGALVGAARVGAAAAQGLDGAELDRVAELLRAGVAGPAAERQLRVRPALRRELLDQLDGAAGQAGQAATPVP